MPDWGEGDNLEAYGDQTALDVYMMRGDCVIEGDEDNLWLEGAPDFPGARPGDGAGARLILCDAPHPLGDDEAAAFILKRIRLALELCRGIPTKDMERMVRQESHGEGSSA